MSFNLKGRIRDVLRNTSEADPVAVARLVIRTLTVDEKLDAFERTLTREIRSVINSKANATSGVSNHGPDFYAPPVDVVLNQRVCVAPQRWKALADCTVEDLHAMAIFKAQLAQDTMSLQSRISDLGATLLASGFTKLAELDPELVTGIWTGARQ